MKAAPIQRALSSTTFRVIDGMRGVYETFDLPVVSTGRSFRQYRKVFFDGRSARAVLDELRGRRVVDIGCGLTPYVGNSMFQACREAGVEFYGVDPKLAGGFRFGWLDRLKIGFVGGRGMDPEAPGLERGLGTLADDLPFEDGSVDLALSYYVIHTWVTDASVLASIFEELHRVLRPGGEVRLFPSPFRDDGALRDERLRAALARFDVDRRFRFRPTEPLQIPPSYLQVLRKR